MSLDPYSPCPCGSGKKFKWCCLPIRAQIDRAFAQDAEGQHEAALRMMDEIVAANPANPEAWGQKAQLLYQNGQADDAESAIQKALEINPNYPYGYLLRGLFRQNEGEIAGALLLFRKAAELYDPDARDILGDVYRLIADSELKLNHPVAAHAALKLSMRLSPSEEMRKGMESLFGDSSRLPLAARRDYTFASPPATAPTDRRAAWDRGLSRAATGKLGDAARAFEELTAADTADAAAWYNLGVVRAWMGDNAHGLEALDRYVNLEADEARTTAAWALAEVLRFGQGMEDQADYVEHAVVFQIRDPQRFIDLLQTLQQEGRLTGVQVRQEEGLISGIVLDRTGLLTAGRATKQPASLGAYLLVVANMLRLWNTISDALDRVRKEIQERAGPSLSDARMQRGPANFGDVMAEALIFPVGATSQEEGDKLIRDHVQRYFEETWIHRPLRSLSGVPPIDAAGHGVLRKKVLGVIEFLRECTAGVAQPYDFDRLRRKLGLLPEGGAAAPQAGTALDIEALGAAELAALQPETLTDEQADQAFRAAKRLDAGDLAARFAQALVSRPPQAQQPDRYPWYTYLIGEALGRGDSDAALNLVDEALKADCEHNEGRRRNDYELRRGQVLSKRGDPEAAREVFERLIERVPSELRFRSTAAETMLSSRQGAAALRFAEQGLAKAREQNHREAEQQFMELVAAARKQVG
jgi:tetratricopeptide (TPR) repeat protein